MNKDLRPMNKDINDLTEAQQISEAIGEQPAMPEERGEGLKNYAVGKKCIIRTYASGVHFGTVKEREGQEVILTDARRIWHWSGAFTLTAVAQKGISGGKMSTVAPEILITQVIEIQPCADKVIKQLESHPEHDPNK